MYHQGSRGQGQGQRTHTFPSSSVLPPAARICMLGMFLSSVQNWPYAVRADGVHWRQMRTRGPTRFMKHIWITWYSVCSGVCGNRNKWLQTHAVLTGTPARSRHTFRYFSARKRPTRTKPVEETGMFGWLAANAISASEVGFRTGLKNSISVPLLSDLHKEQCCVQPLIEPSWNYPPA